MDTPHNRVVQVCRFGGPEEIQVADAPMPDAGSGELRARHPDWFKEDLGRLFALLESGAIRPRIAERISFEEVADAHRRLEEGRLAGKLVLCPDLPPPAQRKTPRTALVRRA